MKFWVIESRARGYYTHTDWDLGSDKPKLRWRWNIGARHEDVRRFSSKDDAEKELRKIRAVQHDAFIKELDI